ITRGCNPPANDRYCPEEPVERDQMASFLARGLDLEAGGSHCERWVAEDGSDRADGSREQPWSSLDHALDEVPSSGCNINVLPGIYDGARIDRRFATPTTIKSWIPYTAMLEDTGTVLDVQGAHNVIIEGFEITHAGPGSRGVVVNVEDANDQASSWITIRDNIVHDSYDNDLLKIRSDARYVTVKGNAFFNQGPKEQHIDVNGVQDVVIEDNIFSNDFAASGRDDPGNTKHFIVVKDSSATGQLGSRRVYIRKNVFLNWQGGEETFLQIGNDGKEYHEAIDVTIENNLILGNSSDPAHSVLGIRGVRDVTFANNTVVGDLPTDGFALWIALKDENPPNQGIELRNNLYVDPTGSMDDFSTGDASGATLDNNLYWNDGQSLSQDGPVNPLDDHNRLIADPLLDYDHSTLGASIWKGVAFGSGKTTIRQEFVRLVERYGSFPSDSPAVDRADPDFAPNTDILGRTRGSSPDLGAFETG
ncbi:MAG TPA: choice-of-anchor Q domain-containing protein, partial [Acidimicrobiia bacterium]|nr:choice-of-anchor Q domain-containing protein [Acidimicrobiia bacterium]